MMCTTTMESPHLRVALPEGADLVLHAVWLYENSSLAIDSRTQQRAEHAFEYPLDLAVVGATVDARRLELAFSDGRRGTIALDVLLRSHVRARGFRDLPVTAVHWDATTEFPEPVAYEGFRDDATARLDVMSRLARFGCAFIDGVPAVPGGVREVTRLIGPIKETNFGAIEDVKVVLDPADLTLTARGIEQHTDNPYRWPAPGYTLLHCLHNSVEGGGSTLIDGLSAVDRLRGESPDLLRALSTVKPTFRYEDGDAVLEYAAPLVELGDDGTVRQVRFSNRTEQVAPLPLAELEAYYAGRRKFAQILRDPALVKSFRFRPGMLLIMDNYRCLHGRAPYDAASGTRHLQLCFMDRDVVASRLRVLLRDTGGKPAAASS